MSSTEKAPYTSLLVDSEKTSLGKLDMFDRVINLKLTVATSDGKLEEFVIRSDYEIYYPELLSAVASNDYDTFKNPKRCYVRKCQYKPSIRVNYKRVSLSTPVAIDIFIANFFMLTKNGTMIKNFNNTDGRLVKVELAMGYFGQFESLIKNDVTKGVEISQLFDFSPEKLKGNGITVITINSVPYVQTDKLPPDAVIHIHGFAGNLYTSSLGELDNTDENTKWDDIKDKKLVVVDFGKAQIMTGTTLEKLLFEDISCRFVKDPEVAKKAGIKLHTAEGIDNRVNGTMTEAEAKKYGIQVYFSKKAKEYAEYLDGQTLLKDSKGNIIAKRKFSTAWQNSAMSSANSALSYYNTVIAKTVRATSIPSTGDILIYHEDELISMGEALSGTALEKVYGEDAVSLYWKDKLPAVYNITTDALCTVVCPFFFFINPFQTFHFKSRYALGGLVSYFGGFTAKEDTFYALWQDVSFATVEDVNECNIVCTGSKG